MHGAASAINPVACLCARAMVMALWESNQKTKNRRSCAASESKMKKQLIQLALGLGLSFLPIVVSAKTVEQAYVDSYRGQTKFPIPISVEQPIVGMEYVGAAVDLKFIVDERGRPHQIVALTPADDKFLDSVVDAVSRWEFLPRRDANGEPVSSKVILPVRIKPADR